MQFSLLSVSVVLFASQTVLASTPYYRSDARCGKDFGGALCNPNGEYGGCCSRYGYCGKTADYCLPSNDCQSGCSAGTKTLKTSVTTLMTLTRTSSSTAKVTPTTTSSTVASVKASTTSATTTPSSTPKPSNKKFTVSSISATYVPSGGVPGGGTRTASCIVSFPVVDQSTSASTTCSLTWNPETTTPKDLVACDDASFKFYFPVLTGCSDFSIHVEHATNGVTNKGTTPEWSRNLYPDGSHTLCSGTAVCTVSWSNDTSPLVAPFA